MTAKWLNMIPERGGTSIVASMERLERLSIATPLPSAEDNHDSIPNTPNMKKVKMMNVKTPKLK